MSNYTNGAILYDRNLCDVMCVGKARLFLRNVRTEWRSGGQRSSHSCASWSHAGGGAVPGPNHDSFIFH